MPNVAAPVDLDALGRVEVVEDGGQARWRQRLPLIDQARPNLLGGSRMGTQKAKYERLERIKSSCHHSPPLERRVRIATGSISMIGIPSLSG